MPSSRRSPQESEWIGQLRAGGHRLTPQRELVLAAVAALPHGTPEQIHAEVARTTPSVSLSTVYRTLELLEQIGVVTHVHLGHGAPAYHLTEQAEHIHLVCRVCGRVTEAPTELMRPIEQALATERGFVADIRHLTIFGHCEGCDPSEAEWA